jgi:hypothetical protein
MYRLLGIIWLFIIVASNTIHSFLLVNTFILAFTTDHNN